MPTPMSVQNPQRINLQGEWQGRQSFPLGHRESNRSSNQGGEQGGVATVCESKKERENAALCDNWGYEKSKETRLLEDSGAYPKDSSYMKQILCQSIVLLQYTSIRTAFHSKLSHIQPTQIPPGYSVMWHMEDGDRGRVVQFLTPPVFQYSPSPHMMTTFMSNILTPQDRWNKGRNKFF